jgi:hypothetical protein
VEHRDLALGLRHELGGAPPCPDRIDANAWHD